MTFIVRHFPSSPIWIKNNIYISKLIEELEKQGVRINLCRDEHEDHFLLSEVKNHALKVDILHFHWTQYLYTGKTSLQTLKGMLKFFVKLIYVKRLGYKIAWTMHNYMPHENRFPFLHFVERYFMCRIADQIIVHAKVGKSLIYDGLRMKSSNKVHYIPHGNFCDFFSDRVTKKEARNKLGIEEHEKILLYFGAIRPYKNVVELLEIYKSLPSLEYNLYLVGAIYPELRDTVLSLCCDDERIKSDFQFVSNDMLALYLQAADIAVLPYKEILGSGALLMALSFGLPVIAPSIGVFAELLDDSCGILYLPHSEGLRIALEKISDVDVDFLSKGALKVAKNYPWSQMVEEIRLVYSRMLHGG